MCIVDGLMREVTAEGSEIHVTEEFDCCIWFNFLGMTKINVMHVCVKLLTCYAK